MKTEYIIEGITLAVTKMDDMLQFYKALFQIEFTESLLYNRKLYTGLWGGIHLTFCPADLAQNTAQQNRHQLEVKVPDLLQAINLVKETGGSLMGGVQEESDILQVGILDPDNNSLVLKQTVTR